MKRFCMVMLFTVCCLLSVSAQEVLMRSCRTQKMPDRVAAAHRQRATLAGSDSQYVGDLRQLVVLVSFSDQSFMESDPRTLWDRVFNEEGFNEVVRIDSTKTESPFLGSVRDYFLEQSYGQFRLTFDLHYIPLSESRVKYRSTQQDDENSKYLVNDLADILDTLDIDWPAYDWDDDGYIDQLLIVYAGKGMNDGGGSNSIWPHQGWLSRHIQSTAHPVGDADSPYYIDSYCCVQELTRGNTYGTFGTICHEYSHCFGFPDFYTQYGGVLESWDLMDSGNMNGKGFLPTGYSSYERMYMGWLTPTELSSPAHITDMAPLTQSGEAYLIRNDGHPDEYYLLENRQQEGWDGALPGKGLTIFHVDYDETIWKYNEVNNYTKNRYHIIPANNQKYVTMSNGWAYPNQYNDALTNDTKPAATLNYDNIDGKKLMSKPITNIQLTGNLVSFEFMSEAATAILAPEAKAAHPEEILYRMGRIAIVRDSNGRVSKKAIKK